MTVRFHPHAKQRMAERGATEAEVLATQVEAYAVREDQDWLVISVIVRYF